MAGVQAKSLSLDNALPATRLLEKCRLMFQVQEALENQKTEFARKGEELKQKEEELRIRDRELQDSLISFSKFLQENNAKRVRAEKKATDEIRIRHEKESEIEALDIKLKDLQEERAKAKASLERMMAYQKYLEKVVETSEEYNEINALLSRFSTLFSTNVDLKHHVQEFVEAIERVRLEMQNYSNSCHDEILNLEADVTLAKHTYEKRKAETAETQLQIDLALQVAASKTLNRGQACMAINNLFARVCQCSTINHAQHTSYLRNLDVIGDYIMDVNQIIKDYKGASFWTSNW